MLPSYYFNETALCDEREQAFAQDIKLLYSQFDELDSSECIDFEIFKQKFFSSEFHLIHFSIFKNESPTEFYQVLYRILIRMQIISAKGESFSLYGLYFIHETSPMKI
jgi:hypothetical protein